MSTTPESGPIVVQDLSDSMPRDRQGRAGFALLLHNVFSPEECQALIDQSEAKGYKQALVHVGANGGRRRELNAKIRNHDQCVIHDAEVADEIFRRIVMAMKEHERPLSLRRRRQEGEETERSEREQQQDDSPRRRLMHAPWVPLWPPGAHYHAVGCHERLSLLRYSGESGHFFAPHRDESVVRSAPGPSRGQVGLVTVQLYLNEAFRGGSTRFLKTCGGNGGSGNGGGGGSSSSSNNNGDGDGRTQTSSSSSDGVVVMDVVPRTGSILLFEHRLLHEGSELFEGRKYTLRTDIMYSDQDPKRESSQNDPDMVNDDPRRNEAQAPQEFFAL